MLILVLYPQEQTTWRPLKHNQEVPDWPQGCPVLAGQHRASSWPGGTPGHGHQHCPDPPQGAKGKSSLVWLSSGITFLLWNMCIKTNYGRLEEWSLHTGGCYIQVHLIQVSVKNTVQRIQLKLKIVVFIVKKPFAPIYVSWKCDIFKAYM